jgi:hypothetical protein
MNMNSKSRVSFSFVADLKEANMSTYDPDPNRRYDLDNDSTAGNWVAGINRRAGDPRLDRLGRLGPQWERHYADRRQHPCHSARDDRNRRWPVRAGASHGAVNACSRHDPLSFKRGDGKEEPQMALLFIARGF